MDSDFKPASVLLAEHYLREFGDDGAFERMLYGCLRGGYVFNTPFLFAAGHLTRSDLPMDDQTDPSVVVENPDTWFIMAAKTTGSICNLEEWVPFRMPWIACEVGGKPHKFRWEHLNRVLSLVDRLPLPYKS